jgi:hypothetical protein
MAGNNMKQGELFDILLDLVFIGPFIFWVFFMVEFEDG